jgi:hypothetical protein
MPPSSTNKPSSEEILQAVDKAFDNFGPKLKPIMWARLQEECSSPFQEAKACPSLLEIEEALVAIFGSTSYVILDWILVELMNLRAKGISDEK